ncbi:RRM domain-containing protein [Psidium guajava]|nr:RRM domain-containing protein [Psidium guajava]
MAFYQPGPSSPFAGFGDTTYTKVFVGGLAWETQSDTLMHYFEQYGDILEAVVITDKNTGRSKGYGFVTFRDPESARRACENPSPVIDGRRANCNLASLGRPRPPLPYGRLRPVPHLVGSVQTARGNYVGNPVYHHPSSYGYQPGYVYPPYGYTTYGPEYVFPQGVYNPYMAQHFLQMYGAPPTDSSDMYSFAQSGHLPPGNHGYAMLRGYRMPGQHVMQLGGPNITGGTTAAVPTIQVPYPTGIVAPAPGQTQMRLPTHSPQFTNTSDQTAG